MMEGQGCWLARHLAEPRAVALSALRGQAEVLAEAIRARDPSLRVSVIADEFGAVVQACGVGLAEREFGGPGSVPSPIVGLVVAELGEVVAEMVGAAVAAMP